MTLPYFQSEELNYLLLGAGASAMRSPGQLTLRNHDRDEDWDVKKAKGQTGASSSLNGQPIGEFEAEFYLVTEEDFERWEAFQKLIDSTTSGPKPIALPIYHPDLARNRYTEVVKKKMGGRVYDNKGGAKHVVKFQEHKPSKPKKPAKAQASTTAPGATTSKPDPNAAAKAKLAALLAEAKKP